MNQYKLDDTIAAISTAQGRSGIGIVRISGPEAVSIADKIFLSKDGRLIKEFNSHTLHYGFIVENKSIPSHPCPLPLAPEFIIDEVLLTVMRAPKTYTCQDIVEINCHGGIVALRKILELCLKHGARLANPGEFTLRAFLNGRIDLTQAESVLNIIDAKTEESLRVAARQLQGSLSVLLSVMHSELVDIVSEFEVILDFPEEDIEKSRKDIVLEKLENVKNRLNDLLKHAKEGRLITEGVKCVIVGKPNVGKSSLMNALLGRERVIVTPIAGTTRDVVEEIIDLEGIPLRVADTAGIIETDDLIGKEGVRRSHKEIENADLIIIVLDAGSVVDKDDEFLFKQAQKKEFIVCINKVDLKDTFDLSKLKKYGLENIVKTVAPKAQGIDELKTKIYKLFLDEKIDLSAPIITNLRHEEALKKAIVFIDTAIDNMMQNVYLELVTQDIKSALLEISCILGKDASEDILRSIFSRFCIGK